jgi:hypothetical protein
MSEHKLPVIACKRVQLNSYFVIRGYQCINCLVQSNTLFYLNTLDKIILLIYDKNIYEALQVMY